jgi:hypothetical protein
MDPDPKTMMFGAVAVGSANPAEATSVVRSMSVRRGWPTASASEATIGIAIAATVVFEASSVSRSMIAATPKKMPMVGHPANPVIRFPSQAATPCVSIAVAKENPPP